MASVLVIMKARKHSLHARKAVKILNHAVRREARRVVREAVRGRGGYRSRWRGGTRAQPPSPSGGLSVGGLSFGDLPDIPLKIK